MGRRRRWDSALQLSLPCVFAKGETLDPHMLSTALFPVRHIEGFSSIGSFTLLSCVLPGGLILSAVFQLHGSVSDFGCLMLDAAGLAASSMQLRLWSSQSFLH